MNAQPSSSQGPTPAPKVPLWGSWEQFQQHFDTFWDVVMNFYKGKISGGGLGLQALQMDGQRDLEGKQYEPGIHGHFMQSRVKFFIPKNQPDNGRRLVITPEGQERSAYIFMGDNGSCSVEGYGYTHYSEEESKLKDEVAQCLFRLALAARTEFDEHAVGVIKSELMSTSRNLALLSESVERAGGLKNANSDVQAELKIIRTQVDSILNLLQKNAGKQEKEA